VDAAGLVEVAGFGPPPDGAVVMDSQIPVDLLGQIFIDGENGFAPRPDVPAPVLVGDVLTLPVYPEGSLIRVEDVAGSETMFSHVSVDGDVETEITLPDAGRYFVLIEPPAPYLPTELDFTK